MTNFSDPLRWNPGEEHLRFDYSAKRRTIPSTSIFRGLIDHTREKDHGSSLPRPAGRRKIGRSRALRYRNISVCVISRPEYFCSENQRPAVEGPVEVFASPGEHFWARGYAVSTVGFELEQVRTYIREQEAADGAVGQF